MNNTIYDYCDCTVINVNDKKFTFDGLNTSEKLADLMFELGVVVPIEEVCQYILPMGHPYHV